VSDRCRWHDERGNWEGDNEISHTRRNDPCPCGSVRKAKRCCGVRRGPSEQSLARAYLSQAAREAAEALARLSEQELDELHERLWELPARDLSLQIELPQLVSPELDRLCDAVEDDDPHAGAKPLGRILAETDTPQTRARLARAVAELRDRGRLDDELAGAALLDLASRSQHLVRASLLQAVAVRVGATRTPAGLLLAA
jgi:hypothetical protein